MVELILFGLLLFVLPPAITLALGLRTSGWTRRLAWGNFALLTLPLLVGGLGGWLLSRRDLAWRSCVKLPCGMIYVAGFLLLLVWAGVFLWRQIEWWRPVIREIGRLVILAVTGFLVLTVGWYGMLFGAIWAGSDRVTEYRGQTVVAEQVWMDWDYYAYHGELVRGKDALGHSWEDSRLPESGEPEQAGVKPGDASWQAGYLKWGVQNGKTQVEAPRRRAAGGAHHWFRPAGQLPAGVCAASQ